MTAPSQSGPATWLNIVNDLLALVNYRGVWADESGVFRCVPYADPSAVAPAFAFDADDSLIATVGPQRTVTADLWQAPNRWVFLWANAADGTGGVPATPVEGNGIYTVNNITDGPASQNARNGLVWPVQVSLTAASQADLVAQGNTRVAADKRVLTTLKATVVPYPAVSHYDNYTVSDAEVDGELWECVSWQFNLDGSDTAMTLTRVDG